MEIISTFTINSEVVAMLYHERGCYHVTAIINQPETWFIQPKNVNLVIEDFIHIVQHELNKKRMEAGGYHGWV